MLETLGLKELRNSYPRDPLVGKDNGSHCVCIIHEPDVILADEPTAGLDTEKAFDVVQLLEKELKRKIKGLSW